MPKTDSLIPPERIERAILLIREQRVILDEQLAEMYDVETGQLVRQLKRNRARFPDDFAFQLTRQEFTNLKCQFGISSSWGDSRASRSVGRSRQGHDAQFPFLGNREVALPRYRLRQDSQQELREIGG